jgi:multiple sugar transport system ATP-binding protein
VARVEFEHVTKEFQGGVRAVDALELSVAEGEFMVLVGPSGCGKTTALRMVAGLETITDGRISIDGRVVNDLPSAKRDIAMVFQNYALYPHMTVFENMAFGLEQRNISKRELTQRVHEIARLLELEALLKRKPRALSGGQRQRVAMGRAIVRRPAVFLMDEPLSNLDAKLRVQMRAEIRGLQRELGVTTIYVTHDQTEAMTMGDRVAVLRKGVLQQVATPHELYRRPVNLFVGGFIGSPAMDLIETTLEGSNGTLHAAVGQERLALSDELLEKRPALRAFEGKLIVLGIRPEDLEDAAMATDAPSDQRIHGKVELTEALGSEVMVHFRVDAKPALTEDVRELAEDLGDERTVTEADEAAHTTMVGRFSPRSKVKEGEAAEVAVDTRSLHFFDPDTGLGIYDNDPGKGAQ